MLHRKQESTSHIDGLSHKKKCPFIGGDFALCSWWPFLWNDHVLHVENAESCLYSDISSVMASLLSKRLK